MLKYERGVSELSAAWTILNLALVGLRVGIGSSFAALSYMVSNDPQPTFQVLQIQRELDRQPISVNARKNTL